jgi:replicative DNA helicase
MLELAANNTTTSQRSQPHNLDAEKSVLGAVFIKPAAFDEIATTLQVDDFFLPAHREIFDAMIALDGRRHPIDVIAVADELKTRGMLPRLEGGESYLLALANGVPTAENAGHYSRLVKEKATLRRLIAACAEVPSSANGPSSTRPRRRSSRSRSRTAARTIRRRATSWRRFCTTSRSGRPKESP